MKENKMKTGPVKAEEVPELAAKANKLIEFLDTLDSNPADDINILYNVMLKIIATSVKDPIGWAKLLAGHMVSDLKTVLELENGRKN